MVKIEDFSKPKYLDYGKVFLVLYFKGFSWKDELKNRFNISTNVIRDSLNILIKHNLVVELDYSSIEMNLKNKFWELNQSYYKLNQTKPKIYRSTNRINEAEGYFLLEALKNESKFNDNLKYFIKKVLDFAQKNENIDLDSQILKEFTSQFKKVETDYEFEELEYLKVLFVLAMKGFSWQKELENEFNISSTIVKKAINLLEKRGFVISKDFYSLDLDSQECIRRLSGAYQNLIKTHPKVYTLSIEGEKFAKNVIPKFKEEAKNNSSLQATVEFIINKSLGYQQLKKEFEKEENEKFLRKRIDPYTGVLFETDTLRVKNFQKDLKIALEEFKQERLTSKAKTKKLESYEKKYLAVIGKNSNLSEYIEKKEKKYNKKTHYQYNEEEISLNDFEKIVKENEKNKKRFEKEEGLSNKDIKKLEKQKKKLDEISKSHYSQEYNLELLKKKRYELYLNNFEKEKKVNKYVVNRQNLVKDSLGINERIKKDKKSEIVSKEILDIINLIKEKGWMDYFAVQRLCKNEINFKKFQKICEKYHIFDDGEDFRYIPNK